MRRTVLRIAIALLVVAAGLHAAPTRAATGLRLRTVKQLTPRLSELQVYSPALGRNANVRVLTPEGFDPSRDHLPVLWLLHGGFGSAANWSDAGAEAATAGLDLIVVMPDGGIGGWYADWKQPNTYEGIQRWETFHVRELRTFVIEHYGARSDRMGHAIAGLSMGGFGAIHDAARHPDLYGFAASFSGAVDIIDPFIGGVVTISPLAHQGVPGQIFGDRLLDEVWWRAANPVDLAANLRTVRVELRTGNGQPGGRFGGAFDIQEVGVSRATRTLHDRLGALGIPHIYDAYGPGAHTFAYWMDDLRKTLPGVMAATSVTSEDPSRVTHIAYEPSFDVWGHSVRLDRSGPQETVLSIRPDGFTLRGNGRGTVTTPARWAPGQVVRAGRSILVARPDGRLVVPVDLGAALPRVPTALLDTRRTVSVTFDPPGNV